MIVILVTPKKLPLILGNLHVSLGHFATPLQGPMYPIAILETIWPCISSHNPFERLYIHICMYVYLYLYIYIYIYIP